MTDKIHDVRELFEYELKGILTIERELADEVLPELREQVTAPDLKQGVERHLEETRGHVRNVERAFEMLGIEPDEGKTNSLDAMVKDHDQGVKMIDDDGPLDIFHAGAIAGTEAFEIVSYKGLIGMAEQLGDESVAALLRENLEQEEHALHEAEQAMEKLLREKVSA